MINLFLASLITAFVMGVIVTPIAIPMLKRLKFGQQIRNDGPSAHLKKIGTPTMGGVVFIIVLNITVLFWAEIDLTIGLALVVTSLYGILGFLDDFIKTVKKRSLGLRAKEKLVGEILIAIILIFVATNVLGRGTDLICPFTGNILLSGIPYYVLAFILIAGVTNGVNLTDGLDGLASGVCFIVYIGYGLIALLCVNNPPFTTVNYLALSVFAAAMAGICLSFLFFNHYPAKLFMGDTGSLFLGGGLAVLSILTATEILLIIIGGVFVLETLSVMIQVTSFKLFGKRVFKMAPLHHHFELKGWSEIKVVILFWTVALLFTAAALLIYTM